MTDEEILESLNIPFKFWRCQIHPKAIVCWIGDNPYCKECKKNQHNLLKITKK